MKMNKRFTRWRRFRVWLAQKCLPMNALAFKIPDEMNPGETLDMTTFDGDYWHCRFVSRRSERDPRPRR